MKLVLAGLLAVALGCHGTQTLTPPPPPLRPEAQALEINDPVAEDCDETAPADEIRPISFDQRSIPEGSRLTEQARAELKTAASAEVDRVTREHYITDAVGHLLTALGADPYNVDATYLLAAAYARIGRRQCSLNLLTRLLQMRSHQSKRADVEMHLDKLLGRKRVLDPDFSELRKDERFGTLIRRMCEGTNSANCVYGGQPGDQER